MADWRGRGETDYKIIREVYDHEDALEEFEYELDTALEAGIKTIIIEPTKLGEETVRWIKLGNVIRYTSIVTSVGSIVSGLVWPERAEVFLPLGAVSIIFSAVHILSWETDPCSKYRVIHKPPESALHNLTTSRPVILVKKGVVLQRFLHTISLAAGAFCGSKIHKWYFQ